MRAKPRWTSTNESEEDWSYLGIWQGSQELGPPGWFSIVSPIVQFLLVRHLEVVPGSPHSLLTFVSQGPGLQQDVSEVLACPAGQCQPTHTHSQWR